MSEPTPSEADIFAIALSLAPVERAAYLERVCGADDLLRRRIEELLEVQGRMGGFMEQVADGSLLPARSVGRGDKTGDQIGRYKLLLKIGEGGCGEIYLAEQAPMGREVAIKLIKPGMDTREVIARFEAERQALALMEHPGIAKVFDAGETEQGRPYFVMELIRGVKITEYCNLHLMSLEGRLRLFVKVCEAVQHAHQKGVIHRDLKPSNILVASTPEGTPHPVVIDFGIAKATSAARLSPETFLTAAELIVGTPSYMSPEQLSAVNADVDTRADIYGLGALLYELLTGSTPFDVKDISPFGFEELRRIIREKEPSRPSALLRKLPKAKLAEVARTRGADGIALIRAVQGDLDWIPMKALEKDRVRRYDTATGLALDIERFLAKETISARPSSRVYRFQKAFARNRLLFSGLTIIGLLLVGSLTTVSELLVAQRRAREAAETSRIQAESERVAAQKAALQSDQVSKFLQGIFRPYGPDYGQTHDTTILKEILEDSSKRAEKELPNAPAARAELQNLIGDTYQALGMPEQAVALHRAQVESSREAAGNRTAPVEQALTLLAKALNGREKYAEAAAVAREALAIGREIHGQTPNVDVATTLYVLGVALWAKEGTDEAGKVLSEAFAMLKTQLGPTHPTTLSCEYQLVWALRREEKLAEAETMLREIVAARKIPNPVTPLVSNTLTVLAQTLSLAGKQAESEQILREVLEMQKQLFREPTLVAAETQRLLAFELSLRNQPAEAERVTREVLTLVEQMRGRESSSTALVLDVLGLTLDLQGKLEEMEPIARRELQIFTQLNPNYGTFRAAPLNRLISIFVKQKRFSEIETLLADNLPPSSVGPELSFGYYGIRLDYRARRGQWAAALSDAEWLVKNRPAQFSSFHALAPLLLINGKSQERAELIQAGLDQFGGTQTPYYAAKLVMDGVIVSPSEKDATRLVLLADLAVNGGMDGPWASYAQLAKALLEYRRGNYTASIVWAEKSSHSFRPDHRVMSFTATAMAQQKLHQTAEAKATLARAEDLARTALPAESDDYGPFWVEGFAVDLGSEWKGWIYSRALIEEAKTVIGAEQK